jgi:hypothetical protein
MSAKGFANMSDDPIADDPIKGAAGISRFAPAPLEAG